MKTSNDITTSISAKTIWGSVNELLQCQWGWLRYEDWCRRDAERMNENGAASAVRYRVQDGHRQCCIANQ